MNKSIKEIAQQASEKRYPILGTYLSNDVVQKRKHHTKGFIDGLAYANQSKQEKN